MSLEARRFVLAPLDRNGVLLGLTTGEVLIVSAGAVITAMTMSQGVGFLFAVVPLVMSFGFAKARFRGLPLLQWVWPVAHLVKMRKQADWVTTEAWNGVSGEVPDILYGLKVTSEMWSGRDECAVIWDTERSEATTLLRVSGSDFALLDPEDQQMLLDGWGVTMAAHAVEGASLARIVWCELAHSTSLDDHLSWVQQQGQHVDVKHRREYVNLVSGGNGPSTTKHDVIVSIVSSTAKMRNGKWGATAKTEDQRLMDALRRSTSMVIRSLADAGLNVEGPLVREEVAELLQRCIDPATAMSTRSRAGDLASRMGMANTDRMGPYKTSWFNEWYETDECLHRSYVIADFPRHSVAADWITDLLARPDAARRIAMIFEPTAPTRSYKRVEREMSKLDTDAVVRAEKGKRVTASLMRSRDAVAEREEELVAGFPEVEYGGVITVSAASLLGLELATEAFESSALQSGIVLRPLDFQHDIGWAASLPLGLGFAQKGFQI